MKRIAGCFLIALLTLLNTGCEKAVLKDLEVQDLTQYRPSFSPLEKTKTSSEMTDGINNFAYDLFAKVYGESDIFISPFSVSLALSMVTTGAASNTEAQLLKSLGFEGKTTQELDTYYSAVLKNMLAIDPTSTISIANAIWSDRNFALKPGFINECSMYFDSAAESVDFSKMSERPLMINDVLHKTFVKVDEKGTEAAALTAVEMFTSSGMKKNVPREVDFKVDRNFLFEIVDRSSNLTVFIGQHKM